MDDEHKSDTWQSNQIYRAAREYLRRAERAEARVAIANHRLAIALRFVDNLTPKTPKPTLTIKESEVFGAKYYDDE